MSLFVIATPIGNPKDISLRAVEVLKSADLIIGEEKKVLFQLLKSLEIRETPTDVLNEHSRELDLKHFLEECRTKKVALVSDAGTPGFCDPGADLVHLCRTHKIDVIPLPGPSSLMTLLSVCGHRLNEFYFSGFLPADREVREAALKKYATNSLPIVLMDTPYRFRRTLEDLARHMPKRPLVLGLDLTSDQEQVVEGTADQLLKQISTEKCEFIAIISPLVSNRDTLVKNKKF